MRKKSIVILSMGLILAFLFFQSCKKSTDDDGNTDGDNASIVGTWNLKIVYKNHSIANRIIVFSGTATEGTISDDLGDTGTYSVGGITVYFTKISKLGVIQYFIGIVNGINSMSGTFIGTDSGTGTWTATR